MSANKSQKPVESKETFLQGVKSSQCSVWIGRVIVFQKFNLSVGTTRSIYPLIPSAVIQGHPNTYKAYAKLTFHVLSQVIQWIRVEPSCS